MRFIYTRTFTIGFVIFALVAVIAISDAKGYLGRVRDGFALGFGFVEEKLTSGVNSGKNLFETFFTIRKLVSENSSLQQKINELSFENARLQISSSENTTLRTALDFKQKESLNLVPVEVVAADPTGFNQVVTINKGSSDNLALGNAVVVAPGLLVGKITSLAPHTASVTLITDPSVTVAAKVPDSGAQGLVSGEHGLGLSFNLVSQNEVIKTQDNVVTSDLSQDFPEGLLIGQIDSIKSQPSELFQQASISPAADLRNLKFLFVVEP
ncbi:MAG TPA: rod shape-determining protein MreC [Patescibacteria group bacterium]|nr:rod shape-determining protein MreC [Patescibacteria group bacterium]